MKEKPKKKNKPILPGYKAFLKKRGLDNDFKVFTINEKASSEYERQGMFGRIKKTKEKK